MGSLVFQTYSNTEVALGLSGQSKLENIANLSLIVACALVVGLLFYNQFGHKESEADRQLAGNIVDLKRIGPITSDRALIVILSTECKYCAASTPFYQRIASTPSKMETIASFRQPAHDGEVYLRKQGIPFSHVVGGYSLVPATPTILLIDRSGKVRKAWVGKLPAEEEQEVIHQLQSS